MGLLLKASIVGVTIAWIAVGVELQWTAGGIDGELDGIFLFGWIVAFSFQGGLLFSPLAATYGGGWRSLVLLWLLPGLLVSCILGLGAAVDLLDQLSVRGSVLGGGRPSVRWGRLLRSLLAVVTPVVWVAAFAAVKAAGRTGRRPRTNEAEAWRPSGVREGDPYGSRGAEADD